MKIQVCFCSLIVVAFMLAGDLLASDPVPDLNKAVVYTMQETTSSDYGVDLAREVGSEVLVRGWFKWNKAPDFQAWKEIADKVHAWGGIFGGGITCSALYDTENGITREQLLDMATRGTDGNLVDAWDQSGIRHGSLSNPAYLDYLFRWCREQIDAGADYLFMDEHTAVLGDKEGYDNYSLSDFRRYLLEDFPGSSGWVTADSRWTQKFKIDFTNREVCPDGTMSSFDYRGYLRVNGLLQKPGQPANSLHDAWLQFRQWRDDRAWKTLTGRIRAYGKQKGKKILISANGLARYVDLQVLGVWGQWSTKNGHIDLSENRILHWRSVVQKGRVLANGDVPVVLFHDWGFGNPPFPWLAVPPSERIVWMRTAGAEIFAAGAFFAFPVLGPFGCDASKDGTLNAIKQQTAFYSKHRNLYLESRYVGSEKISSRAPNLSLAAWWQDKPQAMLIHVINRNLVNNSLQVQKNVPIEIPVNRVPKEAMVVSPDFPGEKPVVCKLDSGKLELILGELDAYSVAILKYGDSVNLDLVKDPARTRTTGFWSRPVRNRFAVQPGGMVANADELNSYIQGKLHQELRNPPTFLVNAVKPGKLHIHVRAVATMGARLEYRVDDQPSRVEELPDRDHKNDGEAGEYDKTFSFDIPAGLHNVTVDNSGGDWMTVTWFEFEGAFAEVPGSK